MPEKGNTASLQDASENIRMAISSIDNSKIELMNSFSGKSFDTYKTVMSEINTSLVGIKSQIEAMI